MEQKRKTTQFLMPFEKEAKKASGYDIYPSLKLEEGQIFHDLKSLAGKIASQKVVIVDGYIGVFFESFRNELNAELEMLGKKVHWTNIEEAYKPENDIDQLIAPFMGADDSIFGTRATISLKDYLDEGKLKKLNQNQEADLNIIYGPGA
ncbi:MAG: hypothetical protein JNL03_06895, partial [Prolixibacteraceae bacterium]|nr:hypothetical protein [Prolixibacteraceae bacterium]